MAYETWIGPTYISGLAGELGVSVGLVSLLATVPWIGSIGQLVGAWAYRRVPSVKSYTLALAVAARALWLIPPALALLWWSPGAEGFPTERWFWAVAAVACCSATLGTSSSAAWSSWVQGLVPADFRGRFFGIRQAHIMGALIVAHLVAALSVGWSLSGARAGYGLLGAFALLAAFLSTWLLSRVPRERPEPSAAGPAQPGFFETIRAPLRDRRFRNFVLFGALYNGAVQIAGPYFPYYYTKELHIPMSQVALWAMLANFGAALASWVWGRRIDRLKNPKSVIFFTGHLIGLSPLPYVVASAAFVRAVAPFEYFMNGVAWAGFQLGITTLLFQLSPRGRGNAIYFSVYAAAAGVAGALGTGLGGLLASWLAPWGGFRALWIVASALRLGGLWILFGLLRDLKPAAAPSWTQLVEVPELTTR